MDAVITIAPKRDSEEFEYEVPDCMVSCICQVSSDGDWQPGEITTFMDDFLKGHILELRETLLAARTSKAETCIFDKAVTLEKVSRQESSVESKLSLSKQKSEGTSGSASRSHLTAGSGYSDPEDRPTTLKQRLLDRKQRRGITTVQPGLEDLGGDPNQNLRHPVGQTVALHKTLENYDRNVSAGGANANVLRKSIEIDDSNDKKNDDSGKKRRFFSRRDKTPKKLTSVSNNNSPTARLRKAITGTDKERNSEGEGNKERFREVLQNLEDSSDDDKINSNHSDRKAFEIESGKAARSFSPIQFDSTTGDEQSGFRSSTGSIQGNRKEPAVSKKKRDKKVNSQASKLRNQIAAKDYELIRLAKTLRKKQNKIHAPTDTEEVGELKHGRSPDSKIESQQAAVAECAMLQKQQVEIQAELQVMRDSYFALTGDVFEPRKPVFSRLRGLAKEKADKREEQESVTAGARFVSNMLCVLSEILYRRSHLHE